MGSPSYHVPKGKNKVFSKKQNKIIINITEFYSVIKNNKCKEAGLKVIRIHDFRHSCASLLINNGADITLVAKYLGHSKIDETLNTYSPMFKNKLDNIIGLIDK